MSEIGAQLFANLEACFAVNTDGERSSTANYALMHEQQKVFHERINNIITSLELSNCSATEWQERSPSCSCEHKVVVWPHISRYQSSIMVLFCALFLGYSVCVFKNSVGINVT